ncbi:hypothetical protein FJY63_00285 [Candidatus Sumerlaeota bacterium]|nr:hypothetical protein [Candidatus Sumerlaeota bacterium]
MEESRCFAVVLLRATVLLAAGALCVGSETCRKHLDFDIDSRFSSNLARPTDEWPDLTQLSPVEIEVYDKYGGPDFLRIWYNRTGAIVDSREAGGFVRSEAVRNLPKSWVFLDRRVEIRFPSKSRYEEVALTDQLLVLCHRGDPTRRERQSRSDGTVREIWTYWDVGEQYFFIDGHQDGEPRVFKGIGRPFMR